jgi:hypothetical protein
MIGLRIPAGYGMCEMNKYFLCDPLAIAEFNRLIYSQPIPPGAEVGHTSIHVKTPFYDEAYQGNRDKLR